MDEYIKRDGVLSKFNIDDMMNVNGTLISLHDARETISNFPAADVAPIRYGRWRPVHASEATGWDPKIAGRDPIWDIYVQTVEMKLYSTATMSTFCQTTAPTVEQT